MWQCDETWLTLGFLFSGTPSRDVLLVSVIITISLSVTIVLCGICQWCQRKLTPQSGGERDDEKKGIN
uniref:Uncharacterized protein n=1 Tax=Laticauda laticaudata TaxID=8630 RepID=A0A8C5S3P1_LATLA